MTKINIQVDVGNMCCDDITDLIVNVLDTEISDYVVTTTISCTSKENYNKIRERLYVHEGIPIEYPLEFR